MLGLISYMRLDGKAHTLHTQRERERAKESERERESERDRERQRDRERETERDLQNHQNNKCKLNIHFLFCFQQFFQYF